MKARQSNPPDATLIRTAEAIDLTKIIEVYGASVRTLAAPYYSAEQLAAWAPAAPDFERWRQRLAPLLTIVAIQDGTLAGFASYEANGHLDFLYTHPAFARRGIATHLYQRIEGLLRAAQVPKVFTEASLAARPFFERQGFQIDGEELVEIRSARLRRFAMHKTIDHEGESRFG